MKTNTRGLIAFAVSLLAGAAALVFAPKNAAAEGCTVTCQTCTIDRNTQTAHCDNCTFSCTP